MLMSHQCQWTYLEHLYLSFAIQPLPGINSQRRFFKLLSTHFTNHRFQQVDLDSEAGFSWRLYFRFFVRLTLKIDLESKTFLLMRWINTRQEKSSWILMKKKISSKHTSITSNNLMYLVYICKTSNWRDLVSFDQDPRVKLS